MFPSVQTDALDQDPPPSDGPRFTVHQKEVKNKTRLSDQQRHLNSDRNAVSGMPSSGDQDDLDDLDDEGQDESQDQEDQDQQDQHQEDQDEKVQDQDQDTVHDVFLAEDD
jgi:hypothetical protein